MANWIHGVVDWFDDLGGKGLVQSKVDGKKYVVHYTAIQSKSAKWKTLKKGATVLFQIYQDPSFSQITKIKTA